MSCAHAQDLKVQKGLILATFAIIDVYCRERHDSPYLVGIVTWGTVPREPGVMFEAHEVFEN